MTLLDVDNHVVTLREAKTGKSKHAPLRDLVDALNGTPLREKPGPDPRIDVIQNDIIALRDHIANLGGNGGPADPRLDEIIERQVGLDDRMAWIENALKSLIVRALAEAEA